MAIVILFFSSVTSWYITLIPGSKTGFFPSVAVTESASSPLFDENIGDFLDQCLNIWSLRYSEVYLRSESKVLFLGLNHFGMAE